MKIIKFLLSGFMVALLILLFFEQGMYDGYETQEKIKQGMIFV